MIYLICRPVFHSEQDYIVGFRPVAAFTFRDKAVEWAQQSVSHCTYESYSKETLDSMEWVKEGDDVETWDDEDREEGTANDPLLLQVHVRHYNGHEETVTEYALLTVSLDQLPKI